jgi:hypothetical protein
MVGQLRDVKNDAELGLKVIDIPGKGRGVVVRMYTCT